MSCITKITADILTCAKLPTKGLKSKAWIFNADEVNFTMTKNKITAITMASGKTSFTAEGAKDFITAGHEAVVAENKLTVYKHNFSIQAFPLTATEKENLDVADNIIVIVEANGEKGEGVFLAYGVTNGLWKTTQTKSSADNNQLPTRHIAKKIGKVWVIQVFDYSPSELCDAIAECCEVIRKKDKISLPLIATECLKRGLSMKHICRILDVKMD